MRALGAYIFAGGFTAGVKRHFDVVAHFEGNDYGVSSTKLNWPDLPVYVGKETWPTAQYSGVDFIYCNPPCAVFSAMGIRTTRGPDAWRTDPRTECWHNAFGLVDKMKPAAWACESVPQAYTTGREMIDDMTKRALMMGYSVTHLFINTAYMGIPQRRKRFFLVLHRQAMLAGYQHNFAPPPTIGETFNEIEANTRAQMLMFTGHSVDYLGLAREAAQGEQLSVVFARKNPNPILKENGHRKGCPNYNYRKLDPNKTMGAFTGDFYFHPTELRGISFEEAKALCGYPVDFKLAGDPRTWGSLLARAVLPPVGEWLARAIKETISHPPMTQKEERRVTRVDLREPEIAVVDLTGQYLNDRGQVKFVVKAASSPDSQAIENDFPAPNSSWADEDEDRGIAQPKEAAVIASKAARVAKPKTVRISDPPAANDDPPAPGEGSGRYIQRVYLTGRHTPGEIVNLVLAHYPGRKTKEVDVYFNYRQLQKAGVQDVPVWNTGRAHTPRSVRVPVDRPTGSVDSDDDGARRKDEAARQAHAQPAPLSRPVGESRPDRPRVVLDGARPQIIMTGFTSNQSRAKPEGKTFNKIDIPQLIADELGQHVDMDWRAPAFGEPIEADGALVFMGSILGLTGCKYGPLAVWTIAEMLRQRKPVVIFYDDWQVTMNHHQLGYTARSYDGAPFKRLVEYGKIPAELLVKHKSVMIETLQTIAGSTWPNEWAAAILKFSGHGDYTKFTNRIGAANILPVDPTPVAIPLDWRAPELDRYHAWFHAALGDHSGWVNDLGATWPVKTIGHNKTGGKVDTERDVFELTARHWGTLSYPYDHGGSGWFRSRFVYAAMAGTVMVADGPDAAALGGPYLISIRDVEGRTDAELGDIAAAQREHLFSKISTDHAHYESDVRDIVNFFKGE